MARKSGGQNRSAAIRAYKDDNKNAKPKDIAAALEKDGIKVSAAYVSTVLSNDRRKSGKGGRRRKGSDRAAGGRPYADLVQAKRLADRMGGIEKAQAALNALARILEA